MILKSGGEEAQTLDPCMKSRGGWNSLRRDHFAEAVPGYSSFLSRVSLASQLLRPVVVATPWWTCLSPEFGCPSIENQYYLLHQHRSLGRPSTSWCQGQILVQRLPWLRSPTRDWTSKGAATKVWVLFNCEARLVGSALFFFFSCLPIVQFGTDWCLDSAVQWQDKPPVTAVLCYIFPGGWIDVEAEQWASILLSLLWLPFVT